MTQVQANGANFFVVNPDFVVKAIMQGRGVQAAKNVSIKAVLVTEQNLAELSAKKSVEGEEVVEIGEIGDRFVLVNGSANANYPIKAADFDRLYTGHPSGEEDVFIARDSRVAIRMEEGFSVIPSWNNGMALNSESNGGWIIVYGEGDYNICSFADFEKTYVIL